MWAVKQIVIELNLLGQLISGVEHYEVRVSLEGDVLKWWYNVEFVHRTRRNST